MKRINKAMAFIVVLMLLLSVAPGIYAAQTVAEAVDVDYKIQLNGVEKSDIQLKAEEERTLIPIRDFAEMLNATVYWIDETQAIQIVMQDRTVVFRINAPNVTALKIADGKAEIRAADVRLPDNISPKLINDKTYIPLRGAIVPLLIDDVDYITEDILRQDMEGEKSFRWNDAEKRIEITGIFEPPIKHTVADLLTLDSVTHYSVVGKLVYVGEGDIKWKLTDVNNPETSIILSDPSNLSEHFWQQQLGTDNPDGCIVMMSGYVYKTEDTPYLAVRRTTTGLRRIDENDDLGKENQN